MNAADKQAEIVAAWKAADDLTEDSALAIANELLKDHPQQKSEFAKWFKVNGAAIVARMAK
jgi:hypothetical protein